MNWQGIYFHTDIQTDETHFLEFRADSQLISYQTSGFLLDFLLAKPIDTYWYKIQHKPYAKINPQGHYKSFITKLKKAKIDIIQLEFEWGLWQWTGIVIPFYQQIVLSQKSKGKNNIYKTFSYIEHTQASSKPKFSLGELVATRPENGHTFRTGLIYRLLYHHKRKEWAFFINDENNVPYSKWYFEKDLLKV
jgi:hypothetical protein